MEQIGLVTKTFDGRAELEVRRASGCGSCKGCASSCEVQAHMVTLKNSIDAKVGDFVELKAVSRNIIKYVFIVYMIPFAFLVTGIAISNGYFKAQGIASYDLLSFLVGIVFLCVSYFILRQIDKKIAKSDESTVVMTKVL